MSIKKGVYIINGVERALYADYEKDTLASVLRRYGMTGLKVGCETGQCGVCTVIVDGEPVRACIKKMKNIPDYANIETIEGIGIASNLHPLQRAWIKYGGVQCGFCTPGFIMSAKALLDKNPNATRKDVRDWFTKNNNLCRCTGYKPLVDAVMAAAAVMNGSAPMSSLDPEIPEGTSIYNSRYPRPAALGKVLGVTDYGGDIYGKMPPETLHMALRLPEYAHARIISVDTSEAEKMPGVVRIITREDIKGTNDLGGVQGGRTLMKNDHIYALHGPGMKVRRRGDCIAIVVARTREEARAAAPKIKVEYEKLPIYESALESCLPDAISVVDGVPNNYFVQPVIKGDDPEKFFEEAETNPNIKVVEGSFHGDRQAHLSLERDAAQAFIDDDGMLTVVYKSEHVYAMRRVIPKVLGIDDIRIIESPTGASFGAAVRYDTGLYAAIGGYVMQQPVEIELSYAEKQIITGKRGASFANFKAAVTTDGKMLGCKYDLAYETGGYGSSAFTQARKGARFALGHYDVEHHRGLCRCILSNNAYLTAYRGAGSPEMFTSSESIVDMMAEAIGMDPFEFRYKNVARPGALTPNGYPFKLYPLEDMMDRIRPTYEKDLKWRNEPAEEGWKRGIGMSIGGYHVSWRTDICEVAMELLPDGKIAVYDTWEMQGQGGDIGALEQAVEALLPMNITADRIRLVQNDSKYCPDSGVAGASRMHFMHGRATIAAGKLLMDAMRKEDGTYRTYDEMIADGIPTYHKGVDNTIIYGFTDLDDDTGQGDPMPDQNFIINIACVEVQESTGKVRIVSSHNIADVGVVGNFLALEGQAYGGLLHSMGYALSEHYSDFDQKCMTPLGCGFRKCNDVPDDFTFEFKETPRELGPFGSGGAAECFQSCCHVSFLNAVANAIGVRVYDMPATPDKILAAIAARDAGEDNKPEPYYLGDPMDDVLAYVAEHPSKEKVEFEEDS